MTDLVRTRFAPSPSGHLHVGGARTALFCRAYAKGRGGRFILRIEDTDRKRSSEAATAAFVEDLAWLDIHWDEGPFYQSQRLEHYHAHIERLLDDGRAYRAFETTQQLDAARRAAGSGGYRYDRAALSLDAATVQQYVDEKRPHVVRLVVVLALAMWFPQQTLVVLFTSYLIAGPIGVLRSRRAAR